MTTGDKESGNPVGKLYPKMSENPYHRLDLLHVFNTVYLLQYFTSSVAVTALRHITLPNLESGGFLFLLLPFLLVCLMHAFRKNTTISYVLISVFTFAIASAVKLASSFYQGKIIFAAGILTSLATIVLLIYTLWAAKKGHEFRAMLALLFLCFLIFLPFTFVQVFIDAEGCELPIYLCVTFVMLTTLIIITESYLDRYDYEDYICATSILYDDFISYVA